MPLNIDIFNKQISTSAPASGQLSLALSGEGGSGAPNQVGIPPNTFTVTAGNALFRTTNAIDGHIGLETMSNNNRVGYAILGVRQGDGFLQGQSDTFRFEQSGGNLAGLRARILRLDFRTVESNSPGNAGEFCFDQHYVYVCTQTNTWKRAPLVWTTDPPQQGPQGPPGPAGPQGPPGEFGELEAPQDGIIYGRKDGEWVDMTAPANLQVRRGTAAEVAAITPLEGEPVWATDSKQLVVGDGITAGGIFVSPYSNQVVYQEFEAVTLNATPVSLLQRNGGLFNIPSGRAFFGEIEISAVGTEAIGTSQQSSATTTTDIFQSWKALNVPRFNASLGALVRATISGRWSYSGNIIANRTSSTGAGTVTSLGGSPQMRQDSTNNLGLAIYNSSFPGHANHTFELNPPPPVSVPALSSVTFAIQTPNSFEVSNIWTVDPQYWLSLQSSDGSGHFIMNGRGAIAATTGGINLLDTSGVTFTVTAIADYLYVPVNNTAPTKAAHFTRKFACVNRAGETALLGTATTIGTDYNPDNLACSVSANNTNDTISFGATGLANNLFRWRGVLRGVLYSI